MKRVSAVVFFINILTLSLSAQEELSNEKQERIEVIRDHYYATNSNTQLRYSTLGDTLEFWSLNNEIQKIKTSNKEFYFGTGNDLYFIYEKDSLLENRFYFDNFDQRNLYVESWSYLFWWLNGSDKKSVTDAEKVTSKGIELAGQAYHALFTCLIKKDYPQYFLAIMNIEHYADSVDRLDESEPLYEKSTTEYEGYRNEGGVSSYSHEYHYGDYDTDNVWKKFSYGGADGGHVTVIESETTEYLKGGKTVKLIKGPKYSHFDLHPVDEYERGQYIFRENELTYIFSETDSVSFKVKSINNKLVGLNYLEPNPQKP